MAGVALGEVVVAIRAKRDLLKQDLTDAEKQILAFDRQATTTAVKAGDALVNMSKRSQVEMLRFTKSAENSLRALRLIHESGVGKDFGTAQRSEDIRAYGAALDEVRAKFSPLFAAQQIYLASLREINQALKVGAINEQEHARAISTTKQAFADKVRVLNSSVNPALNTTRLNIGRLDNALLNLSGGMGYHVMGLRRLTMGLGDLVKSLGYARLAAVALPAALVGVATATTDWSTAAAQLEGTWIRIRNAIREVKEEFNELPTEEEIAKSGLSPLSKAGMMTALAGRNKPSDAITALSRSLTPQLTADDLKGLNNTVGTSVENTGGVLENFAPTQREIDAMLEPWRKAQAEAAEERAKDAREIREHEYEETVALNQRTGDEFIARTQQQTEVQVEEFNKRVMEHARATDTITQQEIDANLAATRAATEAFEKQYAIAAQKSQLFQNILGGALTDLAIQGESFIDVLGNVAKALARVAIQAMVMRAATGLFGAGGMFGPSAASVPAGVPGGNFDVGVWHGGASNVGNTPSPRRSMPISAFIGAPRYHNGFKPGEFPAVLEEGEQVIPKGGSRGGAGKIEITVKVDGARGNAEIEDAARRGADLAIKASAKMLKVYDQRVLPGRMRSGVPDVANDPRLR